MSVQSNAVSYNEVSAVIGYLLGKGYFNPNSPNLPQNISILAEVNTANQSTVSLTPQVITSSAAAVLIGGYGSPLHSIARILFPQTGTGVSCPVTVYPQLAAGGSVAKVITLQQVGTAAIARTVNLSICGRETVDGATYAINIAVGDTPAMFATKANAAISGVLSTPVLPTTTNGIIAAVIHSGAAGTGYAVNDTGTIVNATTGAILATYKVLTLSVSAVATFSITSPGTMYSTGTNIATVATTGTGTGFAVDISTVAVSGSLLTAKWTGLTSNDINVTVDQNPNNIPGGNLDSAVSYTITNSIAGSGTPSIGSGTGNTTGLDFFNNAWNTIVINSYGFVTAVVNALETYNGIPDPTNPTGQYSGTIWRPMWALTGTCLDNPTSLTGANARQNQVTIVSCVAPLSAGMPYEAAANVGYLIANVFGNSPQSDVIGLTYPDMPAPPMGSVPAMCQQNIRDSYVKQGCSTVNWNGGASGQGQYEIVDLVTTYNLSGEYPPFYRWVSVLNKHFNYKYAYKILQRRIVYGKTLLPDNSTSTADNTIKPSEWLTEVKALNKGMEVRGILVNVDANNATIKVAINSNNPDRMDTIQQYQTSGVARVLATTSDGGFYFGS
jgi:hypothetical protein